jgi:hypothetical protein
MNSRGKSILLAVLIALSLVASACNNHAGEVRIGDVWISKAQLEKVRKLCEEENPGASPEDIQQCVTEVITLETYDTAAG